MANRLPWDEKMGRLNGYHPIPLIKIIKHPLSKVPDM
jgi:hypothetical protein